VFLFFGGIPQGRSETVVGGFEAAVNLVDIDEFGSIDLTQ
jgi:hypothetical protein